MTVSERIQALLNKTVRNGCTPGEQAAAVGKARELVKKNGLRASQFKWPPEPKPAPKRPAAKKAAKKAARKTSAKAKGPTRHERVVEMLRRQNGVSLDEVMAEFGIQRHSARAYISVESRKATGGSRAMLDRETGRYYI